MKTLRVLALALLACIPALPASQALPLPMPHVTLLDANGVPLAGGFVFTYAAGTTTPLATYTDSTGTVANPNPIVLDSTGSASIWIGVLAYKLVVQDRFGVQQWTQDNVSSSGTGSGGNGCGVPGGALCSISVGGTSASTATAATHNLQFQSPYTGAVPRADDEKMNDTVSVIDFGADPTGVADSSPAFNDAIGAVATRPGAGVRAFAPCGAYKLNSTVVLSKIQQSLVGENESCVTLQYQGTVGAIQFVMSPESGGDSGEVGNFTIQLPNAISGTYGIWQHTSGAWVHDIQITTCTAGTGFKIDNGLTDNTLGVSYLERNVWTDVKTDHCAIGYRLSNAGASPPPTYMYMGLNHFDSISSYLDLGQVGFELDNGPLFYNSTLNMSCKMGNVNATGTEACVKSSGFWDQNTSTITGEYNNSGGGGSGPVYSVWVTATGSFKNIGGTVAVNTLTPGSTGPLIPIQVDAGGLTVTTSAPAASVSATQPTCVAALRGKVWLVQSGTGVADILEVCSKNSSDAYAWVTH